MANSYSELIRTTLEQCQQGSGKPIQLTSQNINSSFSRKAEKFIKSRLPLTDQLLIQRCGIARNQGVVAARCGQLVTAEQLFAEARALFQSNTLSTEGSLIYKSFQETAEAYLDYRRGAFDRARTRILEALAIDMVLEEEYGYELLAYAHRLELAGHLVRIDARWMRFDRAIDLAGQLMGYLVGASEVLPIQGLWGSERVALLPSELVAFWFLQVTDVVALVLAGKNRQVARDLFAVATRHMHLQTNGNCHRHPRVHAWFLLKEAFIGNDVDTFLERASHFLAEGRADIPILWYAAVVDLVALCDELNLLDFELVRREITRDAVTWEDLPKPFFPLLGVRPKTGI